jgi:GT2 family glycosyltransferase
LRVSVCVPTYRRHGAPNLRTLGSQLSDALDGLPGELVVALNGISAGKARIPNHARVVDLAENQGVPVAWNAAARVAAGSILVFCNDDVSLGPKSLRVLTEALEASRDAAVVGPIGTLWDIEAAQHRAYLERRTRVTPGSVRECDVVSGFLFATPKLVWREVGGFDEAYSPCGFEEVDYCTAARLRLGLRCYAVDGVDYEHEFGVSSRQPWRSINWAGGRETIKSISVRNREHFRSKWAAVPQDPLADSRS